MSLRLSFDWHHGALSNQLLADSHWELKVENYGNAELKFPEFTVRMSQEVSKWLLNGV